jgi:hypothetical protein
MGLSLRLDYPLLSGDSLAMVSFGISSKISEGMSSGELAVNSAISSFRWPNKKKSVGATWGICRIGNLHGFGSGNFLSRSFSIVSWCIVTRESAQALKSYGAEFVE